MTTAEAYVESIARAQDRAEIEARAGGAFEAAVCFQQFAVWHRDGTHYGLIHGVDSKSLSMHSSNGLTWGSGDAFFDDDALLRIADHLISVVQERAAEAALNETLLYVATLRVALAAMQALYVLKPKESAET